MQIRSRAVALPRLFDHLGCLEEDQRGDRDPKGLGGFEIDDELKVHGLLHRQVGRPGTFQELVHIDSDAPVRVSPVWSIGHQAPSYHEKSVWVERGQATRRRQRDDTANVLKEQRCGEDEERLSTYSHECRPSVVELVNGWHIDRVQCHT